MIEIHSKEKCCGCGACSDACPTSAIQLKSDNEGFWYPAVEKDRCIQCGACESVCPMLINAYQKDTGIQEQKMPIAYACHSVDYELRRRSTSGAIWAELAKEFLAKGYRIYGVVFDQDWIVRFTSVDSSNGIRHVQGSKYVQAATTGIYQDVLLNLESGEKVLFCGLPCQIEALNNFVPESEKKNLYLIDIICFGIGSPGIWKDYIRYFHKQASMSDVVFKDKIGGWKHWRVKISEDGKNIYYQPAENLYMNSYIQRINIRPSCYSCPFKGLYRSSDMSIADCWGIGEMNSKLNDDKGLSAVLIHSDKGRKMFNLIRKQIVFQEYPADILMEENWAMKNSPSKNTKRKEFFERYGKENFKNLFEEFFQ